ncbi:MAG: bifunctional hydroxymethylpyrimidine kinase/phosphomethylpyrimidine kinase [Bacteroidales bacterium]
MKQKIYPTALTIAGSDSGGGAGIQADLKTFSSLGVYGASVITAITAQNTLGVQVVHPVPADIIKAQCEAVCSDLNIHVIKLGMLHSPATVEIVAEIIQKYQIPYVITDPVMVATSGDPLILDETVRKMESLLFPLTTLLTPNTHEAARFTGIDIHSIEDQSCAGEILLQKGCQAVLMKGGHLADGTKTDLFITPSQSPLHLTAPTIDTFNTHGTGCTLSSAIAAYLALGYTLKEAVTAAKTYITEALKAGSDIHVGDGHGPVNHFFNPYILHPIRTHYADISK